MKTWPIYMLLQNEYAYGDSHSAPSPSTQAQNEEAARYLDRLRTERTISNALLIGAGGPYELASLVPHLPAELVTLTAHEPECKAINAAMPSIKTSLGDMHEMQFHSGVFDLVFSSNVLEHAFAPYCALMQARRVLKDNGIGYFILPSFDGDEGGVGPFHLHCLSQPVWMELLRKTGFAVADVFVQPGVQPASTKSYTHYRCVAVPPPSPHDRILRDLITYQASQT